MASIAALEIGRDTAGRRVQTNWMAAAIVCLAVTVVALSVWLHRAESAARNSRPLFVLITRSGRAEIVEFGSLSQSALTSVVQTSLSDWAHGNYGCVPQTVTDDRMAAWSMLSADLRASQQEAFKAAVAQCASTPSEEVRIDKVIPTIFSAVPLTSGGTYKALVAFEMVFVSSGRETRREIHTATVQFTIGGQPIASDSPYLERMNPVGISITAFRSERAF